MWNGLGMMGPIGWAVVIPTVLGVALGAWIDARWPGAFPWTLSGLLGGLVLGCVSAWLWVDQEQKSIQREREDRQVE